MNNFSIEQLTSIVTALKDAQKTDGILLTILQVKVEVFEKILKANAPELEMPYQLEVASKIEELSVLKK